MRAQPQHCARAAAASDLTRYCDTLKHIPQGVLTSAVWQDIYYKEPRGLLAGLRAIRDDPAVRLLRVRSGLLRRAFGVGPGEVAVTLQVATEGTRRLGLDVHAVEVRTPLASLKHRLPQNTLVQAGNTPLAGMSPPIDHRSGRAVTG